MRLAWNRPGVVRVTAATQELALLVAGARLALRAMEEAGAEGAAELADVLRGYDRAAAHLHAGPAPAGLYHEGSRQLQAEFATGHVARRIEEVHVTATLGAGARRVLDRADAFFLATADADGRPSCSYKGGDPGFVHVLDEATLAFPLYDGNGMFLSAGNVAVNPRVELLVVDLERGHRLRVRGEAELVRDMALVGRWPGAQLAVRVRVSEAFPNCPRYVHRYRLVERSAFVPRDGVPTPEAAWKQEPWAREAVERDAVERRPAARRPPVTP